MFHYDATITYSEPEKYYFYNEPAGIFEKKPIKLVVKVEDYWPALNCLQFQDSPFYALFNWERIGDMLCCGGSLFSCNAVIENLDTLTTGNPVTNPDCVTALRGSTATCTDNGFQIS